MKRIKKSFLIVPSILLSIIYLFNAFQAFLLSHEHLELITFLGFSDSTAIILLIISGIFDLIIVGFVLFYPKWWNLLIAGIWPIVPMTLGVLLGNHGEVMAYMIVPTLAFLIYRFRVQKRI